MGFIQGKVVKNYKKDGKSTLLMERKDTSRFWAKFNNELTIEDGGQLPSTPNMTKLDAKVGGLDVYEQGQPNVHIIEDDGNTISKSEFMKFDSWDQAFYVFSQAAKIAMEAYPKLLELNTLDRHKKITTVAVDLYNLSREALNETSKYIDSLFPVDKKEEPK